MNRTALTSFTILCVLSTVFLSGLTFEIQPVEAASGTIYIRADGSIDPSSAPISSVDNLTYAFTDNIYDEIAVERDNIIIDGMEHTVEGTGASYSRGIRLSGAFNVTVTNTNIKHFNYGILFSDSSNSSVYGNSITNNEYGVWFYNSLNNGISGNSIIANAEGVYVTYCADTSIVGNNITLNLGNGIFDAGSNNSSISDNKIIANGGLGILLDSSNTTRVSENDIENNDNGINLSGSYNCSVVENEFTSNTESGISISGFGSSYHNVVSGNNITASNGYGISVYSNENYIFGNNITASTDAGIYLYICWGNSIYHNNFIDNLQQIVSHSSELNSWDNGYPSGGNYWSDYAGGDQRSGTGQNESASDGIGDIPYTIDVTHHDDYPLMRPYEGPVRNLDTGYSHSSIQGAIDNASVGDRVLALSGTYHENVVIDKAISLNGESNETTIISGDSGHVVTILASGTIVSNFWIVGNTKGGHTTASGLFISPGTHDIRAIHNIVSNNSIGIQLSWHPLPLGPTRDDIISDNLILQNDEGMWLGSINSTIMNNHISESSQGGIFLSYSSGNVVSDNEITSNHYGFYLTHSSYDNTLAQNSIRDNVVGVYLEDLSDNNLIYHNNFVNNAYQHGLTNSSGNSWDNGYPSGGNYWSDYGGSDSFSGVCQNETGFDWIGDSPYVVDQNNTDRYPLMYPFVPELEEMRIAYRTLLMEFNTLNASYQQHLLDYSKLQENYTSFQNSYNNIQASLNSLNSTCNDLLSSYQTLNSSYNNLNTAFNDYKTSTQSELDYTRNFVYVLTAIAIILIVAIVYLAVRKPKKKQ